MSRINTCVLNGVRSRNYIEIVLLSFLVCAGAVDCDFPAERNQQQSTADWMLYLPDGLYYNHLKYCRTNDFPDTNAGKLYRDHFLARSLYQATSEVRKIENFTADERCKGLVAATSVKNVKCKEYEFKSGQGRLSREERIPAVQGFVSVENRAYTATSEIVYVGLLLVLDADSFLNDFAGNGMIVSTEEPLLGKPVYSMSGSREADPHVFFASAAPDVIVWAEDTDVLKMMLQAATGEIPSLDDGEIHMRIGEHLEGNAVYFNYSEMFFSYRVILDAMENSDIVTEDDLALGRARFGETAGLYGFQQTTLSDAIEEYDYSQCLSEEIAREQQARMKEDTYTRPIPNWIPEEERKQILEMRQKTPEEVKAYSRAMLMRQEVEVDGKDLTTRLVYTEELINSMFKAFDSRPKQQK